VRRATAKRMAQSWSQIPHVTHADEADITELEAFRRKHKEEVAAKGGSLSLTVFALRAAVAALKAFPRFNASLDTENEEIILKNYYHIGVAVDTDKGLIVPSIRDVDRKSIFDLSRELDELIARAREGKVERDDMVGGTFTITNVGPLGGTGFTPIINYPQVAILGLAKAHYRPVVMGEEGNFEIVPRLILPLIVGFDHRVLDGADAARFVNTVISALHDPEQLLMTM
ncbi:MAG: 2-oxo acid dehydrogenase subunit E2, partial [Desulfoferrobacter sp.]